MVFKVGLPHAVIYLKYNVQLFFAFLSKAAPLAQTLYDMVLHVIWSLLKADEKL